MLGLFYSSPSLLLPQGLWDFDASAIVSRSLFIGLFYRSLSINTRYLLLYRAFETSMPVQLVLGLFYQSL
jgi:hypothetical protein